MGEGRMRGEEEGGVGEGREREEEEERGGGKESVKEGCDKHGRLAIY